MNFLQLIKDNGGFTYRLSTKKLIHDGYAVAITFNNTEAWQQSVHINCITEDILQDFLYMIADHGDTCFGAWHNKDDDRVYMDISVVLTSLSEAKYLGKQLNQIAIYDLTNDVEIRLNE